MKKILILSIVLNVFFSLNIFGEGEGVLIDGLYYVLFEESDEAIVANGNNTWNGELRIPEKITYNEKDYTVAYIKSLAFMNCNGLTKVFIPSSIKDILHVYQNLDRYKNPFIYCINLDSINVDHDNQYLTSQDGVLFDKEKKELYAYPSGNSRVSYNVPEGTTKIYDLAFEGSKNLACIQIPTSVNRIGGSAFAGCTLDALVIHGILKDDITQDIFQYMDTSTVIYTQICQIEKIQKIYKGKVLPLSDYSLRISELHQLKGNETIIDLQGRRLSRIPEKGMYIKDGKKYVQK
ncbi:leucine-rich repeat protein [Xylanibacter brevis]|uniref:leucine-rich repeat protein n=1 Tax=Xylanibacter brevis TaxID=83231 RepID=UPI000488D379|nr:leucine-rich repeat protein [Xylanibacter brevis]